MTCKLSSFCNNTGSTYCLSVCATTQHVGRHGTTAGTYPCNLTLSTYHVLHPYIIRISLLPFMDFYFLLSSRSAVAAAVMASVSNFYPNESPKKKCVSLIYTIYCKYTIYTIYKYICKCDYLISVIT